LYFADRSRAPTSRFFIKHNAFNNIRFWGVSKHLSISPSWHKEQADNTALRGSFVSTKKWRKNRIFPNRDASVCALHWNGKLGSLVKKFRTLRFPCYPIIYWVHMFNRVSLVTLLAGARIDAQDPENPYAHHRPSLLRPSLIPFRHHYLPFE
jgi:hypothetical protein